MIVAGITTQEDWITILKANRKAQDLIKWRRIVMKKLIFLIFLFFPYGSFAQDIQEELDSRIKSLKGIEEFHILIEKLNPDIEEQGLLTEEQIKADVEQKLKSLGIKILTEEEKYSTIGFPTLYINVDCSQLEKTGEFIYNITIEVLQQVMVVSNRVYVHDAVTWNAGLMGISSEIEEIRKNLKDGIDFFCNDYQKANTKKQ